MGGGGGTYSLVIIIIIVVVIIILLYDCQTQRINTTTYLAQRYTNATTRTYYVHDTPLGRSFFFFNTGR